MWTTSGSYGIQMVEGDFGIELPMTITGPTFTASDEIKLTIKTSLNGRTILEKTYTNIQQNTIRIELTSSESDLLPVGKYVYSLDWYQDGLFMCNIIPISVFMVVEKA